MKDGWVGSANGCVHLRLTVILLQSGPYGLYGFMCGARASEVLQWVSGRQAYTNRMKED